MKRLNGTVIEISSSLRSSTGKTGQNHGNNGADQGRAARQAQPSAHPQARLAACGPSQEFLETGRDSALETVLFVSNDDYFRSMMRAYLEHVGYGVLSCAEPGQALPRFFRVANISLALIDMHALGVPAGLLLASQLTESRPDLPVILIVGPNPDHDTLLRIEHRGWKSVSKPLLLPELLVIIHRALEPRQPSSAIQEIPRPSPSPKSSPRADSRRRTATFSLPSSSGWLKTRSVLLKAPGILP